MDRKDSAFDRIIAYEKNLHKKNQKRIQTGIRVLLIIPLIFLAIMFRMESNKVVFLAMWIVSLFAIAIYLIGIEYMDYELQMKLKEFGIKAEDDEIDGLITDKMDMEKIIKVANVLSDSFTLEDKEEDNVARLEDKSLSKEEEPDEKTEARPKTVRVSTSGGTEQRRPDPSKSPRPKQANPNPEMKRKPRPQSQTEAVKNMVDEIGVEAAEEELMASIKRYVAEVNKSDQPIVVEPKKTPEDYAKMRKARAREKMDNEE